MVPIALRFAVKSLCSVGRVTSANARREPMTSGSLVASKTDRWWRTERGGDRVLVEALLLIRHVLLQHRKRLARLRFRHATDSIKHIDKQRNRTTTTTRHRVAAPCRAS